jgi:hypothetical protein
VTTKFRGRQTRSSDPRILWTWNARVGGAVWDGMGGKFSSFASFANTVFILFLVV